MLIQALVTYSDQCNQHVVTGCGQKYMKNCVHLLSSECLEESAVKYISKTVTLTLCLQPKHSL